MRAKNRSGGFAKQLGIVAVLALCALGGVTVAEAQHADTPPPLKHMQVNLHDKAALRTGALYFMYQCSACHSLEGTRFSELAAPLGLSAKAVQSHLNTTGASALDTITTSMPTALVKGYLGTVPPDLTVEVKHRSVDWLYTYLTSFYLDPSRPTGVNNVAFHNVAMPDVFAGLQGLQTPITAKGYRNGQKATLAVGVKPLTAGSMSPADFDRLTRDLVSFLYLTAYPHQMLSHTIGLWVLIGIAVWIILMYLVYRLYWRDVVKPDGPRWWAYWRH